MTAKQAVNASVLLPLKHSAPIFCPSWPGTGVVSRTAPFLCTPVSTLTWRSCAQVFKPTGVRRFCTSRRCAGVARFTSEAYPDIKRDERFAQLNQDHVAFFRSVLGTDNALIDGVTSDVALGDLEAFNADWTLKYRGHCRLVLKPDGTEQVSKILRYCNEQRLAVVPQGGNTGLVGGSVPVFDEIVINMARMKKVRSFDEVSGILEVEAGAILEVMENYLDERNYVFPLDLGAKGTCQIGGNVSTNAGGLRLLRYGSLHGTVLGIEAVLPDGTIVDDLSKLRKNNTGYDLKHLFIGAEGTIGIITAVSVICPQKPSSVNVAFLGLNSYEQAQKAFREARARLGEILSAFELIDQASLDMVHKVFSLKKPLENDYPFYCLIETSGSNAGHDSEKLEGFLDNVMSQDIVADGVVAQDGVQIKSLWKLREAVPEVVGHWGGVYKYDVSIPLQDLYLLVEDSRKRLLEAGIMGDTAEHLVVDAVGYGHMGDANLHLNVAVRKYDKQVERVLEPWVYEWIQKRRGSISAEHGLGLAKKKYIGYSKNSTMLALMKQIKSLYDPCDGVRPECGKCVRAGKRCPGYNVDAPAAAAASSSSTQSPERGRRRHRHWHGSPEQFATSPDYMADDDPQSEPERLPSSAEQWTTDDIRSLQYSNLHPNTGSSDHMRQDQRGVGRQGEGQPEVEHYGGRVVRTVQNSRRSQDPNWEWDFSDIMQLRHGTYLLEQMDQQQELYRERQRQQRQLLRYQQQQQQQQQEQRQRQRQQQQQLQQQLQQQQMEEDSDEYSDPFIYDTLYPPRSSRAARPTRQREPDPHDYVLEGIGTPPQRPPQRPPRRTQDGFYAMGQWWPYLDPSEDEDS